MDVLEVLRHRINWIYDCETGHTDHEYPIGWSLLALQQEYFELTGFEWDAKDAKNIERNNLT